jgi:hypothetical protein
MHYELFTPTHGAWRAVKPHGISVQCAYGRRVQRPEWWPYHALAQRIVADCALL